MTTKALRFEFVITGAAMLLALFALDQASGGVFSPEVLSDGLRQKASSGAGFLALGILLAAAYVAGVFCVFLTFVWPTETLITKARTARLRELTELDSWLRDAGFTPAHDGGLLRLAFGEPAARNEELDTDAIKHSRTVAQTLARVHGSEGLIREYEYRRSNRQVLTGLIPALAIFAFAGLIGTARGDGIWFILSVVALALAPVAYFAAKYQERVGQSLLADAGFLRRWLPTES